MSLPFGNQSPNLKFVFEAYIDYDPVLFRADQKNIIHVSHNVVPFVIKRGQFKVEILDPISAELLDLDTVYNQFENSSLSLMDHLFSFFNGVRQRGIETTEELLKEGTQLTGCS